MPALATRIEREAGRPLTPIEIFNISASRETTLSRLLTLYICTGLAFMLLPGTFLGVWNLIAISYHQSTQTVSAAWIQRMVTPRFSVGSGLSSWGSDFTRSPSSAA